MAELILRGATLPGRDGLVDLVIAGGRFSSVGPSVEPSSPGPRASDEYRLDGRLALPALVDIHVHLDKANAQPDTGVPGDLPSAIAAMGAYQARVNRKDMVRRGLRLLDQAASFGVGTLRTHVNVGGAYGLRGLDVALELREKTRGRIRVQVVAMASAGVLPGTAGWALMEEAVRLGGDALGGSVGVRTEPAPLLDGLFGLAARRGLPLDLHVDEHGDPRCPGLEALIPRTIAAGYQGRVTAGHCCALGLVDADERKRLIDGIVKAGIAVVALPLTNLFLQGRDQEVPGPRGIAPVRALVRQGALVACASDNVQDPYLPYGNGDPLLSALVLGVAGHLTTAVELDALVDMVTVDAAKVAGLTDYGLAPGRPADLVILDAKPPDHPAASLPRRWLVIHGGVPIIVNGKSR
ncbi:MAG: amidohydrolase family protein [Bacillota bacterium]